MHTRPELVLDFGRTREMLARDLRTRHGLVYQLHRGRVLRGASLEAPSEAWDTLSRRWTSFDLGPSELLAGLVISEQDAEQVMWPESATSPSTTTFFGRSATLEP